MQIINLIQNPASRQDPMLFSPIAGQLVQGEPLGHSTSEIYLALKKHFQLSEQVQPVMNRKLEEILGKAELILNQHFDLSDTTIYIAGIDDTEEFANKYLQGVSGYAWPNAVLIYLNPNKDWQEPLLCTTLHEFNHCQRYRYSNPYDSLLDWIVFEGLAETFEFEMASKSTENQKNKTLVDIYLPELQKIWHGFPTDGHHWFHGSEERKIPVGLGYLIGSHLVEQYRRTHSGIPWKKLVATPSQEFVNFI